MIKKGDKGALVIELQQNLLLLGERLPRWGVDGSCGQETIDAVNHVLLEHKGNGIVSDEIVSAEELAVIETLINRRSSVDLELPLNYVALTTEHPVPKAQLAKRRPWSQITSIVLHQTACELGENPKRWFGIPIHFGITRQGQILYLNELTWNLPHANGLNSRSVGIEIDGTFEGVEGDRSTWWPSPGYKEPMRVTREQVESARDAIRLICSMLAKNGGKITHILAHRQSSSDRVSDPGSRIWQDVGLWAQREIGLSDGGDSFLVGDGRPLPKEWDSSKQHKYL